MGLLNNIYDNVPIFVQNIMVSIKGYLNSKTRYGKVYYEYLDFLEQYDEWTLEQKKEYRNSELKAFLKYVIDNSSFYRELYKGIDLDKINCPEDLTRLPVVDKETLRKNIDSVVTAKTGTVEGHTGGTTGKSLIVQFTKEDMMKRMAQLDHFKRKVGFVNNKMKRATFNAKHIVPPAQKKKVFWRYNKPCKQMIFSSFHITDANLPYYVKKLNKFKPLAIDGFFTSMCDVANYIERKNIKLTFRPIAIFPTSETLTDVGRSLLERVFGCKVYDQYASSEGAPFVTECAEQKLHVQLASGIIEKFEDGSDEVLVTSFTTHGTPLIRYKIGDSMKFAQANSQCTCGDNQPIVEYIQGRALDFLYTAEGAKINAGSVANLFKNMPNSVIRAQLVQDKMDEVTAFLETDSERYSEKYDEKLLEEFERKFGKNTKLNIVHVEGIDREKSGKFRMIKNNVDNALKGK